MTPLPQRSGPSVRTDGRPRGTWTLIPTTAGCTRRAEGGSGRRRKSAGAMRLMTDLSIPPVSLLRGFRVGQILREGVGPRAERRPPLELPAVVSKDRVPGARGRALEVLRADRLQARAPEPGGLQDGGGEAIPREGAAVRHMPDAVVRAADKAGNGPGQVVRVGGRADLIVHHSEFLAGPR